MADKLTNKPVAIKGDCGIDEWLRLHVIPKQSLTYGSPIKCQFLDGTSVELPCNQVGILFEDCKFMRQGDNKNYGGGGSNCVTGNPVCFVDVLSVHLAVFNKRHEGILSNCIKPCFVVPLVRLDSAPDLLLLANDMYCNFVALKHGDVKHDITHVANGISCQ